MAKRQNITVYGASSPNLDPVFTTAAYELGRLIGESGRNLYTGAGSTGLMAAVENGALDNGGHVTGIIPQFMIDNGWLHQGLSEVISTPDIHSRKALLAQKADAVVALPGGTGTFEELTEIITWKMLGLFKKPIVILNTDHYYDDLLKMLENGLKHGFIGKEFATLWSVAETPLRAMELIDSIPDWNSTASKI